MALASTTVLAGEIARVHEDARRWLPSMLMLLQLIVVHLQRATLSPVSIIIGASCAAVLVAAAMRRRRLAVLAVATCGGLLTSMLVHTWWTAH